MPKWTILLASFLGSIQLLSLFWMLVPIETANKSIVRFEMASRCDEGINLIPLNNDGIIKMLDQPVRMTKACWHNVSLPENNPAQDVKVVYKTPQLRRIWYRIHYYVEDDWDIHKPLMIYIPRILGQAWQIKIGDRNIADNRLDWRSTWNRSVSSSFLVEQLPPDRLLTINIGVISSLPEGFSIARISIGDAVEILNLKKNREFWQAVVPQVLTFFMLILCVFLIIIWLRHRANTEYLFLSINSLAFTVTNLNYHLEMPNNLASYEWYKILITSAPEPWMVWSIYMFCARFANFSFPWVERLLWFYIIVNSLIILSPVSFEQDYSTLTGVVCLILVSVIIGIVIWQVILTKNFGLLVVAVWLTISIPTIGIHDILLSLNIINPEGLFWGPYNMLMVSAGFLIVIQRRYMDAILGQEQLNCDLTKRLVEREELTLRLTEREAELRTQQNRLLELERSQTLAEERQRLMHDMHDGLGSSLLTTLAAIEKDNLPQKVVAEALRTCIEDLRLVIDSLEPTAHDLVTLLATIRYRLGQRLEAAGLQLKWEINDLPPLPWLEPPDALNVLRLVQEALVNVLKHANATHVRVATHHLGQNVEIQIEDNGCGFDPNLISTGRGMHSQTKRAVRLGGELNIQSILGRGTFLQLLLPVNKSLPS